MILNPPNIVCILRWWKMVGERRAAMVKAFGLQTYQQTFLDVQFTKSLAEYFRQHLGPMEWDAFKRTYQLYLQSIPFATAREAWGLVNAGNPDPNKP